MLRVENLTQGTVLIDKGRVADNPWTRLKGLLGVRHLAEGDGLLIKPCNSVHCMFMSMTIDVLYLDKDNVILGFDHQLKPWRIGTIYRHCRSVIELPAGTIAKQGVAVGEQLKVMIS